MQACLKGSVREFNHNDLAAYMCAKMRWQPLSMTRHRDMLGQLSLEPARLNNKHDTLVS